MAWRGGASLETVGHEAVERGGGARRQLVAGVPRQPGVSQHRRRAQPLARLPTEQRPDQALAARRQTLRHHEEAPRYLREQRRVLGVVERIPVTDEFTLVMLRSIY